MNNLEQMSIASVDIIVCRIGSSRSTVSICNKNYSYRLPPSDSIQGWSMTHLRSRNSKPTWPLPLIGCIQKVSLAYQPYIGKIPCPALIVAIMNVSFPTWLRTCTRRLILFNPLLFAFFPFVSVTHTRWRYQCFH